MVFSRTKNRRCRPTRNLSINFLSSNILPASLLYAWICRTSLPHIHANYLKINGLFNDPLKKITAISPLLIASSLIHRLFAINRAICSATA
jgi:hypothetical protein